MLIRSLPHRGAGFTLIEVLVTMAIAALLVGLATPSSLDAVRKARRFELVVRMLEVEQLQERWRGRHGRYGTLAELGLAAQTTDGHYQLSIEDPDRDGYQVVAQAQGGQARDLACRWMRLEVDRGATALSSGPDAGTRNAGADQRRCWGRG